MIPCGADFINHNVLKDSSMYYDDSLGTLFLDNGIESNTTQTNRNESNGPITMNNANKMESKRERSEKILVGIKRLSLDDFNLSHNLASKTSFDLNGFPIERKNENFKNISVILNESDYQMVYLWLDYGIKQFNEMFVNYGKTHTSANRMALFGFIDSYHPWDSFDVRLDLMPNDSNFIAKRRYFETVWNSDYLNSVVYNYTLQMNETQLTNNTNLTNEYNGSNSCSNISDVCDANLSPFMCRWMEMEEYGLYELVNMNNLTTWIETMTSKTGIVTVSFESINMTFEVYAETNATELKSLLTAIDDYLIEETKKKNNNETILWKDMKQSLNRYKYFNQVARRKQKQDNDSSMPSKKKNGQKNYKKRQSTWRLFEPPVTIEYTGINKLQISNRFLKSLRLMYLPEKYFDSFTISSILNENNMQFLNDKIDSNVEYSIHSICNSHLNAYPTSLTQDREELKFIESKRKKIIETLNYHNKQSKFDSNTTNIAINSNNNNNNDNAVNWTDYEVFKNNLLSELTALDRESLILQYRIREKDYWSVCSRLHIVHYFQTHWNKLKSQHKKKHHSSTAGSTLDTSAITTSVDGTNSFTNALELLMNQLVGGLFSSNDNNNNNNIDIAIDEFDITIIDEFDENDIITSDSCESSDSNSHWMVNILSNMLSNDATSQGSDSLKLEYNIIENGTNVINSNENNVNNSGVSRLRLVIGKPRRGSRLLASTKGWNSPSLSNTNTNSNSNRKASNGLNLMNLASSMLQGNNQRVEHFSITGNGNGFTLSTGDSNDVQISGTSFSIDGNNINIGNGNNLIDLNSNNNDNVDIPETVPFESIMTASGVVAYTIDPGTGQLRQLNSNSLGNIDMSALMTAALANAGNSEQSIIQLPIGNININNNARNRNTRARRRKVNENDHNILANIENLQNININLDGNRRTERQAPQSESETSVSQETSDSDETVEMEPDVD